MDEKKRLIAIITTKDRYFNYGDDHEVFVTSISDWTEVTEKEFQLLSSYSANYNWRVIERLDYKKDFIPKTVAAALAEVEKFKEEERKRKAELEKRKLERELKKKAKTEEQEKALLKELAQKYGKV